MSLFMAGIRAASLQVASTIKWPTYLKNKLLNQEKRGEESEGESERERVSERVRERVRERE
jgi:hypothetical protein